MATVYILYSKSIDRFYTGSCKDLDKRLNQHLNNKFEKSFTSKTSDWEIYHVIEKLEYSQARKIEKHIKKMKSKKYVQNLKRYPEIIEKLKQKFLNS
jgi:putative endonuclease